MLCYVSSENAGSQEKMPLQKCHWRHFVLLASSNPLRQLAPLVNLITSQQDATQLGATQIDVFR